MFTISSIIYQILSVNLKRDCERLVLPPTALYAFGLSIGAGFLTNLVWSAINTWNIRVYSKSPPRCMVATCAWVCWCVCPRPLCMMHTHPQYTHSLTLVIVCVCATFVCVCVCVYEREKWDTDIEISWDILRHTHPTSNIQHHQKSKLTTALRVLR